MKFTRLYPHTLNDSYSFFEKEADSTIEKITFEDLLFHDENEFIDFCDKLNQYSGLKDLRITYMNNLSPWLMNPTHSAYFYNVLNNLKSLESLTITDSYLNSLNINALKQLLETLVQSGIKHINLSNNTFNPEQIRMIKTFEKQHTDHILMNLNLPKILATYKLPKEIETDLVVPFLQDKSTLYYTYKVLNDRMVRHSLLSPITSDLNSAAVFEQYVALNGGNKAKAGALTKKFN